MPVTPSGSSLTAVRANETVCRTDGPSALIRVFGLGLTRKADTGSCHAKSLRVQYAGPNQEADTGSRHAKSFRVQYAEPNQEVDTITGSCHAKSLRV